MDKHEQHPEHEIEKSESSEKLLSDRLMQEINILRLEGALFCFDPREAKRRKGQTLTLQELRERPVMIEIQNYGQPSVLAYKVLQAIFLKLAEDGCQLTEDGKCLYREKVSFSQRELSRLISRVWSGRTSNEIYNAIMQLRSTIVHCSFYDKEDDVWETGNFNVLSSALFSARKNQILECVIELDRRIVASINRRHIAFFNLYRLNTLDTIGVVLYKRVFFHLSNINQKHTPKDKLKFEKDYEDICREWLGGLKPLQYRSDILRDQLGRHLEALKGTRLIRKYEVTKKAGGKGLKIVFYPGPGFFDDYRDYYLKSQQPKIALPRPEGIRDIQLPLELVAEFHRALGHSHQRFEEKETAYASELLKSLNDTEVRDLISYAVEDAQKTGFADRMRWFGALRNYRERWAADRVRYTARKRHAQAIAECAYCNEQGYIPLSDAQSYLKLYPCPHDIERINALEEERGLRRI